MSRNSSRALVQKSSGSQTHPGFWGEYITRKRNIFYRWYKEFGHFYCDNQYESTERSPYWPIYGHVPSLRERRYLDDSQVSPCQPVAYLTACLKEKMLLDSGSKATADEKLQCTGGSKVLPSQCNNFDQPGSSDLCSDQCAKLCLKPVFGKKPNLTEVGMNAQRNQLNSVINDHPSAVLSLKSRTTGTLKSETGISGSPSNSQCSTVTGDCCYLAKVQHPCSICDLEQRIDWHQCVKCPRALKGNRQNSVSCSQVLIHQKGCYGFQHSGLKHFNCSLKQEGKPIPVKPLGKTMGSSQSPLIKQKTLSRTLKGATTRALMPRVPFHRLTGVMSKVHKTVEDGTC